ncbi:MAG: hypothetical protein RB292_02760 [Patescibacteria group bacterium]|jgi:hypothetical protein|nr:hypothetical protein [Patescibacteria group bacterium]
MPGIENSYEETQKRFEAAAASIDIEKGPDLTEEDVEGLDLDALTSVVWETGSEPTWNPNPTEEQKAEAERYYAKRDEEAGIKEEDSPALKAAKLFARSRKRS